MTSVLKNLMSVCGTVCHQPCAKTGHWLQCTYKTENVSLPAFTMTLENHPALLLRFRDSGDAI